MKKLTSYFLVIVILLLTTNITYAQEKLGLVIIAHGSPMPQWNIPVLNLEKEVKNIMSQKSNNQFSAIRVALMEFNEPSISTVIKDFEKIGINKVYAIPLLVAPSGHSLFDIPTILGLYSDKDIINEIRGEGIDIVDTRIKITVGPTLNNSDVLKTAMLNRVKELSTTPNSEGVVLLTHGDKQFEPIWSSMCKEICHYVCAKTGIEYFDYSFVEIGQSFATEGVSAILKATEKKEKTIVVGLYLSMGVEKMATNSALFMMGHKIETKELFTDKNIHFAQKGILPDKQVSEWIVDVAIEWAENLY
jgi:cobalamin biosynthesis Co2+ chelatase CbiK